MTARVGPTRAIPAGMSLTSWLIYTDKDEMRAHVLKAGYADNYNGWMISWNGRLNQYEMRAPGKAHHLNFSRKADAYRQARRMPPGSRRITSQKEAST